MGEQAIVEIARRLQAGETVRDLRDMRGIAYALGAKEQPPAEALVLPSYEEIKADRFAFAKATRIIHQETNPLNAKTLVQFHDRQAVVANPPGLPISEEDMDRVYGLPYTRRPHPMYQGEKIPAFETVKDSVTIMRGCFGGCTFCSITAHQGRIIQSRSKESVLNELKQMGQDPNFSGVVSDIGGPTANMYQMRCTKPEVEVKCKRLSCVHPKVCKLLGTDHGPLVELMRESREVPGIRKVFVASGIRMDLAQRSPEYMEELAAHHVGGHLKVAPEHTDPDVLKRMKKPDQADYAGFADAFKEASAKAGKPKQYLVPYYIASHPGSDLNAMIDLALFLKRNGYRPDQVQDFIPAPFDIATAVYYTGLDPFTGEEVYVAKGMRDRKMQRALMQFFKVENYFMVREALLKAGRPDLIGNGCDALIPSQPPKAALDAKRKQANASLGEGKYVHQIDARPDLLAAAIGQTGSRHVVRKGRGRGADVAARRGSTLMRSQKGSHRIVVSDVEYRWRATGDDGYISIGIWPSNNIGPYIHGNLRYHETWIDNGNGSWSSAGNQIVVTNRIIRRIIEHATASFGYDPQVRGKELNLRVLDDVVEWSDAVRAIRGKSPI